MRFFCVNNIPNDAKVMLDLFDAMQCDFDTNPFEHIDRFHFNICINCSQNFYSNEQFASKHASSVCRRSAYEPADGCDVCMDFLLRIQHMAIITRFSVTKKKTYRTKMISNAFVFIDQRSKLELPTATDRHERKKKEREKKRKGEAKQNRFFITF